MHDRVEGTVRTDATGVGAQLVAYLMPWRRDTEIFDKVPLRVEVWMERQVLTDELPRWKKGALVAVECSELAGPGAHGPWWLARGRRVEKVAPPAVVEPVVIRDPVLGLLTLEPNRSELTGTRVYRGRRYNLAVSLSRDLEPIADEHDVQRAGETLLRIENNLPAIRATIGAELLAKYNGLWRGERRELSLDAFDAKITLSSVGVHPDGQAHLYFSDGDLFGGHWIEVLLDADGNASSITLAG